MGEGRPPLLDAPESGTHETRVRETAPVDPPPGWISSPYAFPWVSSLAIGWKAVRSFVFPTQRGGHPAEPDRSRDGK